MKSSLQKIKKKHLKRGARISFWFSVGAFIALFLISSFSYMGFQRIYKEKVYPGVKINGVDFGHRSETEVKKYFTDKNILASDITFVLSYEEDTATISAKEIEFGYDENLLASQALSIGKSKNYFSNIAIIFQAYAGGIDLSPAFKLSQNMLNQKLSPLIDKIDAKPTEALFTFENGRVTEFRESKDGKEVDKDELNQQILSKANLVLRHSSQKVVIIPLPVKTVKPSLTTEKVNQMGIRELIGTGTSTFKGSIENRIFNLNLAANRLNGLLIEPGKVFSFNNAIGDVSSLTGYKQAYVIQNGRTVLGDGGGVCQVSTTFFRAILNSGLPVEERNQHAYRVGYYEQDSSPGIDAAIYTPNIDLKFKNDTGRHILIQTIMDPVEQRLTFMLYGTNDGRISVVSEPVILSQSPAPEPKYEDDPNLPKGQVKQVDFAAAGAKVYFKRTVTKNGKVIIDETFNSNYRPWQAVYLRGTKE